MKRFTSSPAYILSSLIFEKPFTEFGDHTSIDDSMTWDWEVNYSTSSKTSFTNRTLLVRVQNQTFSLYPMQNGVLQDEIFSVLLFLISIDHLTKCLHFPLTRRLFTNDYNTIYPYDPQTLLEHLDFNKHWTSFLCGHENTASDFSLLKPTLSSSKKSFRFSRSNAYLFKVSKFQYAITQNFLASFLIRN